MLEPQHIQLTNARRDLASVDERIISGILERFRLIDKIGTIKKELSIPLRDIVREKRLFNEVLTQAGNASSIRALQTLYKALVAESLSKQLGSKKDYDHSSLNEQDDLNILEKKPYVLASRRHQAVPSLIPVAKLFIGGGHKVVIAGPCAVESEEHIMTCAAEVKKQGGHLLRGGCFKSRTSSFSLPGMSLKGLRLLQKAGLEFDLPVVTEIMDTESLDEACEHADVLQINSGNKLNFSLLDAVGRLDKPVILKRGLATTVDEWLSAAERILLGGNNKVILCEQGLPWSDTSARNVLDITSVSAVKRLSHLPIIVDPSHASEDWHSIFALSRAALAADSDGILIRIDPDPIQAKSDGPQALDFQVFEQLMVSIFKFL